MPADCLPDNLMNADSVNDFKNALDELDISN